MNRRQEERNRAIVCPDCRSAKEENKRSAVKAIVMRGMAVLAVVLVLAGCQKDVPPTDERIDYSNLKFEVQVGAKADYSGTGVEARAVKPGWAQGDKIVVYFDGSQNNSLWLAYDEQEGWWYTENNITSLAPSGAAQALYATDLHPVGEPGEISLYGDMVFTDAGSYDFDGTTVRLTLDMTDRITSRVTVEGLTEPYVWSLSGSDLSVQASSYMHSGLFEGSFDAALRALFELSGAANGFVMDYHDEGSVSFFVLNAGVQEQTTFVLRNHYDGSVYTRTYSGRKLEPGKAVVIQGPEGAEAGQWTNLTVLVNALQNLIDEVYGINTYNYTRQSLDVLFEARNAAYDLLFGGSYTADQLTAARNTLQAAIDALVELPYRAPAVIYVNNAVDNMIYVNAGAYFHIYAEVYDAHGDPATDRAVDFDIIAPVWMLDVNHSDYNFSGLVDEAATAGAEVQMTIKSRDVPSITRLITIKVVGDGELKAMFLNAVAALPLPADIDYDDIDALEAAGEILNALHSTDSYDYEDQELVNASAKLQACLEAYWNLPLMLQYTPFSGNTVTLTSSQIGEPVTLTYAMNGSFPYGTYTSEWEGEPGYFEQFRITFNSNGTFTEAYRYADNSNGANASPWEVEGAGTGTFTYTGTPASGGTMTLTYDEDEGGGSGDPSPGRAAKSAGNLPAKPHRLFKR